MKMRQGLCFAFIFGMGVLAGASAFAADASGLWRTPEGAIMKLYRCGAGYCGSVNKRAATTAALDVNNKDPKLRKRKINGLQVIWVDKQVATNKYSGKAYNPRDGNTYTGHLYILGADKVKVGGCVLGFLCKNQTWTRIK